MKKRKHQIKKFTDHDVRFLLKANMVEIDNGEVRRLDEEYDDGVYSDVKEMAKAGKLRVVDGVWEVMK